MTSDKSYNEALLDTVKQSGMGLRTVIQLGQSELIRLTHEEARETERHEAAVQDLEVRLAAISSTIDFLQTLPDSVVEEWLKLAPKEGRT